MNKCTVHRTLSVLYTVHTALDYLRVLLLDIEEYKSLNIAIMRVVLQNFKSEVIELFTKIKYFARIRDLNEQHNLDKKADLKRKAAERKEIPKQLKKHRDFCKNGHFLS